MRWGATIIYLTDAGLNPVQHDIEELEELQALVERGPDWRSIDHIEIKLQRFDQQLTVEQAAKL